MYKRTLKLGDLVKVAPINKKRKDYRILMCVGVYKDKNLNTNLVWYKLWHADHNIEIWPRTLIDPLENL